MRWPLTVVAVLALAAACDENKTEPARLPAPVAASPVVPPKPERAAAPQASPSPRMNLTVDQLFTMFTGNANGPDDLKKAEAKYRGTEVILRGTVYETSAEMKTITLKGSGLTYANCQFDSALPNGFKKGKTAVFHGVVAGFFMQVNLDHCAVASPAK